METTPRTSWRRSVGGRIKGTLGDIDPLNKVPLKRARSRVQKGYPLRGLPNTTPYSAEGAKLTQFRGLRRWDEGRWGNPKIRGLI